MAKENAAEVENIGGKFLPPKICQNCEGRVFPLKECKKWYCFFLLYKQFILFNWFISRYPMLKLLLFLLVEEDC